MKNKTTNFGRSPNKEIFVKNAVQAAILLLATGGIATAQTATPAKADEKAAATQEVQQVVVTSTGTRGSNRTVIDTPVPVDVLAATELTKTAQASLDKALAFRVPSFNTVQTPVNDATSLLDPYEIRNMGPSRSLILINGKRKNASSLVYTQTSPGRGESGADISAIPQDAIKRIEVLRDGASAQYGSDAISGVVNIILKDNPEGTSITGRTGVTHEGDGKMQAISINHGLALGDSGFVNMTVDFSKNDLASRSGIVSARGEAATFGNGPDTFTADLAAANAFLAKKPDAGNINGSPDTRAAKFLINTRYDFAGGASMYANAAYIDKKIDSYANYRTPYWRPTDYGLLRPSGAPYEGYVPGFLGALKDYNATVGVKFDLANWSSDVSLTFGGNEQTYTVTNSVNRGMEDAYLDAVAKKITPLPPHGQTRFDAGGSKFNHTVFNADFSKDIAKGVSAYFGTEIRAEQYTLVAGEPASWLYSGADSYAGNTPTNSFTSTRSNYGVYGGTMFDVTDALVLDATARFEHYSDFGNATIGKLSAKYKVNDEITLRGSLSSGFRAPSLHQIYTQKAQYSFSGGSIQVSGLASNVSAEAAALGVPKLKAEKSTSITLGIGYKPSKDTSMTLDYYNISLKDRIILGKEIKPSGVPTAELDKILKAANIVSLSFFANALDSKTSGIDYVFNHRNMKLGDGKLHFNWSGNYSLKNERDGEVNNPAAIAKAGQSVLDITQEALMFTSRPKYKSIIGFDYDISDFNFSVNNTVFGPTKFRNADLDQNLAVVFKTKTLTDFSVNYQINKNMTLAFAINNMFNVTPSWKLEAAGDKAKGQAILDSKTVDYSGRTPAQIQSDNITFNQRYSMVTYDGSHFSQLGRIYNLSLNYRF
ncbi:TonB-dependent receptor plug domain-containing protein [Undibacterium macrobrachii]|uniref:Ligand-gated channel n=1 Tax=Undibacterium macrobrachii TaxID=1119058 RepID=A0ABQ2XMU7_9BURK|nr:TonB-dependent receptor [Undibacterium macrobrachii]GGX25539.1 ligand-gated channel [Undibacterium macrobrachii]